MAVHSPTVRDIKTSGTASDNGILTYTQTLVISYEIPRIPAKHMVYICQYNWVWWAGYILFPGHRDHNAVSATKVCTFSSHNIWILHVLVTSRPVSGSHLLRETFLYPLHRIDRQRTLLRGTLTEVSVHDLWVLRRGPISPFRVYKLHLGVSTNTSETWKTCFSKYRTQTRTQYTCQLKQDTEGITNVQSLLSLVTP